MPHECTTCGRVFPDGSKEMLSGCPDCGGNKFQFAPAGRTTTESAASSAGTRAETSDGTAPAGSADGATSADDAGGDRSTPSTGVDAAGTVERATETVREWVSSESTRPDGPADRSSAETGADDGSPAEVESREFDEWPETARRPEDRSGHPDDPSAGTDSDSRRRDGTDDSRRDQPAGRSSSPPSRSETPSGDSIMADDEDDAQADARSALVSTDDLPTDDPFTASDRHADDDHVDSTPDAESDDDQPPGHGRVVSEPSGDQPTIDELRAELNEQFESIKIVSPGQYELNLMELYNREEYIISLQEDGRYVIDVPDSWRTDDG